MGIPIVLLGAAILVGAASIITPIILRHITNDGVYHAHCVGNPAIPEGDVTVSADSRHLILANENTIAIIAINHIQSVTLENTIDGLHHVLILWLDAGSETLTSLAFTSNRDAHRVVALLR